MTIIEMPPPLVTPEVFELIAGFLAKRPTGQLVLHVKEGQVMQVETNTVTKVRGV